MGSGVIMAKDDDDIEINGPEDVCLKKRKMRS
jgi:hypothetical protein